MPKTFSVSEREYIRARLLEEGQSCLTQYGLRKTTVDELVRRVNIPKGTFYLFYPSKEVLFLDVFTRLHDQLKQDLLGWVEEFNGHIGPEEVTELIFRLYQKADGTFLSSFIAGGDLELLIRKLPAEVASQHIRQDDFSMEQLLNFLGVSPRGNVKVFSAVLRAIFFAMLHRDQVGADVFDEAMRSMIRGAVLQLYEVQHD